MPYIEGSERVDIDASLHDVLGYMEYNGCTQGQLNYIVTKIIKEYINIHGKRYAVINDVIGVLEAAKLEMYRRVAAGYEDHKIETNGDVY